MSKKTLKQIQIERTVMNTCSIVDVLFSNKVITKELILSVIPIGWNISSRAYIDGYRYFERDLQVRPEDIADLFSTLSRNRIHIQDYFQSEKNDGYLTIRLNVVIDSTKHIHLI